MTSENSLLRRLAGPGIGIALVSSWVAGMAYVYSASPSLHATGSVLAHPLFAPQAMASLNPVKSGIPMADFAAADVDHGGALALVARVRRTECGTGCVPSAVDDATGKSSRKTLALPAEGAMPVAKTLDVKFDAVAASVALSPQKLAAAFSRSEANEAGEAIALAPDAARFDSAPVTVAALAPLAAPSAERFGVAVDAAPSSYILALAVPEAAEASEDDLLASIQTDDQAAVDPFALPQADDIPVPVRRPTVAKAVEPAVAAPAHVAPAKQKGVAPARKTETVVANNRAAPALRSQRAEPVALAYAAPDDGAGSVGKAFKNLFNNGPAAVGGKKVAVYNISARTVTMPDGEVLEAYSGIGEMANNPKYVGVKMRGPTPPDTYRLKMRESRFHGVEAIRMLPVDGKVKLGRTGILAHSQLLRGRKGQSHGCVAFKDYAKFLAAFKRGKVTHMVVIAGNGRGKPAGTNVASNDRNG